MTNNLLHDEINQNNTANIIEYNHNSNDCKINIDEKSDFRTHKTKSFSTGSISEKICRNINVSRIY